jgi:cytosine/uracil/thiamine/allantoin permease
MALTIGMGTGIPLLSVGLSSIAGTLASQGRYGLATFAGGLCVSALTISLPHLAWAIRDITKTERRAAWALAIAVDLALVLCELVRVSGAQGMEWVTMGIMGAVCIASMLLNCWTFVQSPKGKQ